MYNFKVDRILEVLNLLTTQQSTRQHNTMQRITTQCNSTDTTQQQHNGSQHNVTQCNKTDTTQRITTQRNATRHNGLQHNATQCNRHNTTQQNSPQHNKMLNKSVEVTSSSTKKLHRKKNSQKTLQVYSWVSKVWFCFASLCDWLQWNLCHFNFSSNNYYYYTL